jgi:hypothetical protein
MFSKSSGSGGCRPAHGHYATSVGSSGDKFLTTAPGFRIGCPDLLTTDIS